MYKWGLVIWALLCFLFVKNTKAQSISNEGTDFWTVFPSHVPSVEQGTNIPKLAEITVFVTSKYQTEVTVTCGSYSETKPVPPNEAVPFDVSRAQAYIDDVDANKVLTGKGIHIKVSDGKPGVSAYAHIYAGQRSAASLILPYETLGQKYYSMNYTQSNGGNNFLVLIASEDSTKLIIHKKDKTTIPLTLPKKGDVYQYMAGNADLTGVFVEVDPETPCRKFVAYSGSTVIAIGNCAGQRQSYDPLYQQLYPVNSWGKNYGVVPFINRKYILRVMAQQDSTTFIQNGQAIMLKAGEFAELGPFIEPTFISADKLISVAQYSLTQSCSSATGGSIQGDPEMVMLNPIEFSIKNITVFSSTKQDIKVRYINVLIKENRAASFKINGQKPSVTWAPLNENTSYVYAQIAVTDLSLNLTADEGFNAIAYGFGDAESYAYSAGTNLSANNFLSLMNTTNRSQLYPNGCVGETFDFKITLPYQVSSIHWTLDSISKVETNLQPESKVVNGEQLFEYTLVANKQYLVRGHHEMEVRTSIIPSAASCAGGEALVSYSFDIYDLPTAIFEVSDTGCATVELQFTDKSNSNTEDFPIKEWFWDFGDGQTSTDQNPKHAYANPGAYTVSLSVKSGVVCASDVAEKHDIVIHPLPLAKFSTQASTCINTDLLFTVLPTPLAAGESVVKWIWNFGENDIVEREDALPFTHRFPAAGTYKVSLVTTSLAGCNSIPYEKDVEVMVLPQARFELPAFCLADGTATFINKSVNSDGLENGLTYTWDFGDPGSADNTSISKDGHHDFRAEKSYRVKLTVSNLNGCIDSLVQEFTVNGAVKSAGFTVQNESSLCSDKDVLINNTSEVFFGKISKIEIYKDFIGNPSDVKTVVYPSADDIHLSYPTFGGNDVKKYTIRLVAYSGATCFEFFDKEIILYPMPVLAFNPIPEVCENDGSIVIDQASETSGMTGGIGVYSGSYVTAAGLFNAKVAKAGLHAITYTYTTLDGCPASITRNITVYQSPDAYAGETIYILAGGFTQMKAKASAGATYSWSPALGLDRTDLLNPLAFPALDTKYTLTVSTDHCSTTSEVWIRVLQELKPSNAFSPNGDNINDTWEIKYLNTYPSAMVQIFNRYGQLVFSSHGYANPFDGNYQGNPLPVGTYYYMITPNNGRQKITGSLTLIR